MKTIISRNIYFGKFVPFAVSIFIFFSSNCIQYFRCIDVYFIILILLSYLMLLGEGWVPEQYIILY